MVRRASESIRSFIKFSDKMNPRCSRTRMPIPAIPLRPILITPRKAEKRNSLHRGFNKMEASATVTLIVSEACVGVADQAAFFRTVGNQSELSQAKF